MSKAEISSTQPTLSLPDPSDPDEMLRAHTDWVAALNDDNAVSQHVLLSPWINLVQVGQIIDTLHPDSLPLFSLTDIIAPDTFRQHTEGKAYLHRVIASGAAALSWNCIDLPGQEFVDAKFEIEQVIGQARFELGMLQNLCESDLRDLEESGSVSTRFDVGKNLLDEFQRIYQDTLMVPCRASAPPTPTVPPTVPPTTDDGVSAGTIVTIIAALLGIAGAGVAVFVFMRRSMNGESGGAESQNLLYQKYVEAPASPAITTPI
jgi:hypothetical protein